MAAYMASLNDLAPDALEARYEEEYAEYQEETARIKAAKAELAQRTEQARFFNQPSANADFVHWSKAAHWTLDEANALILGKAPEIVNWRSVKSYVEKSPFAFQYSRIRDLALRAERVFQLSDPVLPTDFLDWAKRLDIPIPERLESELAARSDVSGDWKAKYEDLSDRYIDDLKGTNAALDEAAATVTKLSERLERLQKERDDFAGQLKGLEAIGLKDPEKLGNRERSTLLKMVIGMAVAGYTYDPSKARNPAVSDIVNDMARLGVAISDDTARNWLREATKLLPKDPSAPSNK